ncbi:MAG: ABC transporter permease [Prevotella sp.]|nr:ABC transporter permease [Prevotella sp.]
MNIIGIICLAILILLVVALLRKVGSNTTANLFKVSIKAVANNKMRSFLSMLGIIIGVSAVIIMMSIGQGSKESIRQELSTMGTNLLTIRPGADMRGGVRQDPSAMQTLKMADYERILREKKFVTKVSPEVTASGQVIYGNNNTNTTVYGESTEYLEIKLWDIEEGMCFTEEDVKKASKKVVVGATIVKELFGEHTDPIGKTIRFKSIPMTIVGVLKSKGYNNWGMDQDNVIIAPYTTVMKRIAAQTWFSSINCSAVTEELSDAAIEELTQILRDNHKLKGEAADDFTIRSQAEFMETMSSTMDTVTLILVVAAAFSLLVAGIGIMNIMLVSVTERTKEIGLRMAVGATGSIISFQFLIESVLISITGGLIGILFGCTVSEFVVPMLGMPSSVPAWSIFVSFLVCVVIGIAFGYIPALKAARMDPIEAIRHE